MQNYKGAIEDLDKAIEINTKIISKDNSNGEIQLALYYGRAEVKLFSGDAVGAIEDCNNAINSNNKYGSAYLLKGKINLISNQINEGCINLRRAYALGQYDALKDLNQFCLVNFDEKSKDILKNQVKKSGVQEIYLIHVTPEDWGCEKQVIWNSAAEKVYGYTECRMELTYKGIKTVEEVIFDKFGIPPYSDDILYELWTNKLVKGVDKSNLIYEYWNNGKVYVKYRNQ